MQSILSISASGARAAQAALGVAGHNIANLGTGGFRRQELRVSTDANGGVSTSVAQSTVAGHAMETDLVALLQARTGFMANLQVFKAGDRMLGALLDTTG
jgi:flagellar hook-associated protein FlgK